VAPVMIPGKKKKKGGGGRVPPLEVSDACGSLRHPKEEREGKEKGKGEMGSSRSSSRSRVFHLTKGGGEKGRERRVHAIDVALSALASPVMPHQLAKRKGRGRGEVSEFSCEPYSRRGTYPKISSRI